MYPAEVKMSEKTQVSWNGLGRLLGLGGIVTGPKLLAGWLVTSLETFKASDGFEWPKHILVDAVHRIEYLAWCPEYGAPLGTVCNMFVADSCMLELSGDGKMNIGKILWAALDPLEVLLVIASCCELAADE
ncbi:hypothetical protein FB451DRAFT_1184493 [Mycena latifolia]|nr:hypothetical protein FB451DRAFT_1184493 [Mycena latifolia]